MNRKILTVFTLVLVTQCLSADSWPQWRGLNRDAKSGETGLLKEWPEGGPKVIWKIENAGVGYSSVSVDGGKIYTMGDLDGVEHILAFDEKTGERLWATQPAPVAEKLNAEVEARFAKMDTNQDGKIDEFEIISNGKYQTVKYDSSDKDADIGAVAEKRAAGFLAKFDTDGNGSLNILEIPSSLGKDLRNMDRPSGGRREASSIAEKRASVTIAALDQDKNGTLEKAEIKNTVLKSNTKKIDTPPDKNSKRGDGVITADELKAFFKKQEAGFDGIVTAEELKNYFAKNHPGKDGVLTVADFKGSMGGYRNGQGDGPRGTPSIAGNRLYTEGGNGDVTCLDAETGKTIWHKNLVTDFGGKRPGWGYSESPLVVEDRVFVTPGSSESTIVALNSSSGEPVWKASSVNQGAGYASPILATIGGKKQVVQFGRESMFGVAFETGTDLWHYTHAANKTANCATAIIDGDYVLASSAYGTGGGVTKITNVETAQHSAEVWFDKKIANHHGGLVKVGGYIYGFGGGGLICTNFLTGEIKWTDPSVKKGSLIYADGMLYCQGEKHEIALVEANPEAYVEKGRFPIVSQGRPSWAHPVIANGVLYIRDQQTLTAYDLRP